MEKKKEVYYSDYLQLDKILGAQTLESDKVGQHAHDEMLFIIIHQSYELWFKQILFEVGSVMTIFDNEEINDNSPIFQNIIHRLNRCVVILEMLVKKIDIIETMTPLDFLDFRDLLSPASGFQSIQFKMLEAALGLKMENRHGKKYYVSALNPEDKKRIEEVEKQVSLKVKLNAWLERMPFFNKDYWLDFEHDFKTASKDVFFDTYKERLKKSLSQHESATLDSFNKYFYEEDPHSSFSVKAKRALLFINLYQGYPILQLPFQLLQKLIDIDDLLGQWRSRHVRMVKRTIGSRVGTGGSSGAGYLQKALESHYIFTELTQITSFLIERKNIPVLGKTLDGKLGYQKY